MKSSAQDYCMFLGELQTSREPENHGHMSENDSFFLRTSNTKCTECRT